MPKKNDSIDGEDFFDRNDDVKLVDEFINYMNKHNVPTVMVTDHPDGNDYLITLEKVNYDEGETVDDVVDKNKANIRAETGPMKFGNDWTGIFIRGDNAMGTAMELESLSEIIDSLPSDIKNNKDIPYLKLRLDHHISLLRDAHDEVDYAPDDLQQCNEFSKVVVKPDDK